MDVLGFLKEKISGDKATSSMRVAMIGPVYIAFGVWGFATVWMVLKQSADVPFNMPDIPYSVGMILIAIVTGKVAQKAFEKPSGTVQSTATTETKTVTATPEVPTQ